MEAQRPLPFPMRLLIAFLVIDGLAKLATIVYAWSTSAGTAHEALVRGVYDEIVIIVFYFLLAIQLGLRTSAGRFWTIVCFSCQVIVELIRYTVTHPELWVQLGLADRAQVLGTQVLLVGFVLYLLGSGGRRAVTP